MTPSAAAEGAGTVAAALIAKLKQFPLLKGSGKLSSAHSPHLRKIRASWQEGGWSGAKSAATSGRNLAQRTSDHRGGEA